MYLTCGPGSAQFRDFRTIFKNLSSLHPCGVCLSVAPPAHLPLQCWRSQGSVFVLVQSLCFRFFPNWQNIMFFNSGFWAARLIEIMHQIAQRPKTCSGQGSCFCFMAMLWDDCNVNHDGINRSTHPAMFTTLLQCKQLHQSCIAQSSCVNWNRDMDVSDAVLVINLTATVCLSSLWQRLVCSLSPTMSCEWSMWLAATPPSIYWTLWLGTFVHFRATAKDSATFYFLTVIAFALGWWKKNERKRTLSILPLLVGNKSTWKKFCAVSQHTA